jgi:hypothetical protein
MKHLIAILLAFLLPAIVAAQVIYPNRGGTGTSVIPTIGYVLVGQSNGTYAPQATSTLGIASGGGGSSLWEYSDGVLRPLSAYWNVPVSVHALLATSTTASSSFAHPVSFASTTFFNKVRIGTGNPVYALDVNSGDIHVQPDATWSSGDNADIFLGASDSGGIGSTNGTGVVIGSFTSDAIMFRSGWTGGITGTERMRINGGGNVGIGTTSPVSTFAVQGTSTLNGTTSLSNLTLLPLNGSRALFLDANDVATTTATSGSLTLALTDETGSGVAVFGTSPTFTTRITTPEVSNGSAVTAQLVLRSTTGVGTSDSIVFRTGNNVERGRISTGGQWSIGTSTATTTAIFQIANPPASSTNALSVFGTSTINGGLQLNTTLGKPTCIVANRGMFWASSSPSGEKDTVEVCAKDAADAYAWRTIY